MAQTRVWLGEHLEEPQVWAALRGLLRVRPELGDVAEVVAATRVWLGEHPEDVHVRTALLGLLGARTELEGVPEVVAATPARN